MKKIISRFFIPLLITFAIIYFFFRDISLNDIKENFLRIPLILLLMFIFLSLLGTLLRAAKYHILLGKKLKFTDVFLITLVRNFAVDLLPARSAALIFYTYLTKKKGVPLEEGASSFVVSVFYDGLALSFMLGILIFFLKTEMNRGAIYLGMFIIFAISVGMIFFADKIFKHLLKLKCINRFCKFKNSLKKIETYLLEHEKNSERLAVFGLSFLIRIIKYIFIYILFEGVVHLGWGIKSFSLFCFGLAGTELSALLPIQGLGGFGTWELAFALVFGALRIPAENLREAGFVIHITTQVWEYLIGLMAFLFTTAGNKDTHKEISGIERSANNSESEMS